MEDQDLSLVLDEEQKMLENTAAQFVRESSPVTRVRQLRDSKDAVGFSRDLWKQMAELGFVGMHIPESYGGTGLGFFELAIVLQQAGRTLMPEPFLGTVLLGAECLLRGGNEAQKQAWLPKVASGDALLTVAYLEARSRFDLAAIDTKAKREGDAFVLDGEKVQVLDGHVVDALIVSAKTERGLSLFLVPRDAKGVSITKQHRIDGRNASIVRLTGVRVGADALVGAEGEGLAALSHAVDIATIGLACEMLGASEQAFEDTVAYIKVRKQFGVPIGSFQALQHRAARLFIELSLTRSAVLAAARTVDVHPESIARLASLAKAKATDTMIHVTNEAVQMHGGVGVTDEYDVGFYVKRARVAEATFGDAAHHRDRFARENGY